MGGRDVLIAYAPQDPWIMDGMVRENVLLGCEYDSIKYVSGQLFHLGSLSWISK